MVFRLVTRGRDGIGETRVTVGEGGPDNLTGRDTRGTEMGPGGCQVRGGLSSPWDNFGSVQYREETSFESYRRVKSSHLGFLFFPDQTGGWGAEEEGGVGRGRYDRRNDRKLVWSGRGRSVNTNDGNTKTEVRKYE